MLRMTPSPLRGRRGRFLFYRNNFWTFQPFRRILSERGRLRKAKGSVDGVGRKIEKNRVFQTVSPQAIDI
jgi:hypothetical protein